MSPFSTFSSVFYHLLFLSVAVSGTRGSGVCLVQVGELGLGFTNPVGTGGGVGCGGVMSVCNPPSPPYHNQ